MCYDEGVLQAYLDGEATTEEKHLVEKHLAACSSCRGVLKQLEENNNFVSLQMTTYKKQFERMEPVVDSGSVLQLCKGNKNKKGVFALLGRYKKLAVAAAAAACIGVMFSFAPVRSAAADFLTLFRVQKVETSSISVEELNQIQQVFYNESAKLDIDNFGSVENKQTGEQRQVKWEEAASFLSFDPRQPSYMPDGLAFNPSLSVEPANKIEFTLNVKNVNTVIEHLGGQYPLPAALEGRSFGLNFHEVLQAHADAGQGDTYRNLRLLQTRSPEVTVPENVDVTAVRKAILEMPMIPNETKQKLASLSDWQNTLYIPSPDSGTAEELTINGSSGVFIKEDWGNGRKHSLLIWQDSGVLFVIDGTNLERGEIVKVAESLK